MARKEIVICDKCGKQFETNELKTLLLSGRLIDSVGGTSNGFDFTLEGEHCDECLKRAQETIKAILSNFLLDKKNPQKNNNKNLDEVLWISINQEKEEKHKVVIFYRKTFDDKSFEITRFNGSICADVIDRQMVGQANLIANYLLMEKNTTQRKCKNGV